MSILKIKIDEEKAIYLSPNKNAELTFMYVRQIYEMIQAI